MSAPRIVNGKRVAEYAAWIGARQRCGHMKGGGQYIEKGIKVCDEWLGEDGYDRFYQHIGAKPSPELILDRIRNLEDYKPGNVRWATPSESNSNKSDTNLITINGVSKPLSTWCDEYHIGRWLVRSRIKAGWNPVTAVTTPR